MTKSRCLCLVLAAGALAACSSREGASEDHPQPAASQGQETTPPEPMSEAPAQHVATPAASAPTDVAVAAGPTAASTLRGGESLRDSQVVQVTRSVDEAEIEQATLARNKARDPRVQTFAEHMIEQHTRSKQDSAELAKKARIEPEDSRTAAVLQGKAGQTLQLLRTVDASQFDATYMNSQVQQHDDVLKILDEQLIPSTDNTDLKAALRDTRALVVRHLTEAKELASNLKR